ncbi:MAG: hypothetical protein II773_03810 [Oscillospiraceae bacterium]|nr:hypothetical protein [Oscillospiraceae bacterium]MBQ4310696.1 hypothetical protein [Oscillospiraceae bacterium]
MNHSGNKNIKRLAAAAAAAAMTVSLAGCGENAKYCAVSGTEQIPAGVYIYYLVSAYSDAQSRMTETDTDVFATTVEDKPAATWMSDTAREDLIEYAAIENKFSEYGLSLSKGQTDDAKSMVESMWTYYGEYYENYGISEDSFRKTYQNMLKSGMIFDNIYGEGGERAVSDDELRTYLRDNYAKTNYIKFDLVDFEGTALDDAAKAERRAEAESYLERAKNGEDMNTLSAEYTDHVTKLREEYNASKQAEEDAAAGEANVTPSPASANDAENADQANVWADTADESADETAEEADAVQDIDISTDMLQSVGAADNVRYIKKDSGIPDAAVNARIFAMNAGDFELIEGEGAYYVVSRLDIFETDDYYNSQKSNILHELRDEEYESLKKEWAASAQLTLNNEAMARYTPQELKSREDKYSAQ